MPSNSKNIAKAVLFVLDLRISVFNFSFLSSEPTQHLDQSLSPLWHLHETFSGRPFGICTSCVEVEWRLRRGLVLRDYPSIEDCCKTKRTFIVHTPPLHETSTGVWLLAYLHYVVINGIITLTKPQISIQGVLKPRTSLGTELQVKYHARPRILWSIPTLSSKYPLV